MYADSLPLKIYKLPSLKGNAFLTYSPARIADGNNVAFEYKDSVYEDIRNYLSVRGLTTPSDISLKENIFLAGWNDEKLLSLPVKEFNYKSDKNKIRYTGLIAQELKLAFPELVTGAEGHYSIDYPKMVPYLIKILQDQHTEIERLKAAQSVLTGRGANNTTTEDIIEGVQQQLKQQQEQIKSLQAILINNNNK